jgi:catalase (peroxidase I)
VNQFVFRAYSQLRVLVEGYGLSDAEKNFVAAWNDVNLERFNIA